MTNTLMTKEDTALVVIDLQTDLLTAMSVRYYYVSLWRLRPRLV